MPQIFVSHAAADAVLTDPFVDDVLRLGCGLDADQIFYTSGADTGIPSGLDLLHHVRERVAEAGLVIAVITPTFQSRPVCIAEMGAAWSRTGKLFPIAVPGMGRVDLEGVLSGVVVRYLDDSAALDELHKTVGDVVGEHSGAPTWGQYKAKWLASVAAYVAELTVPAIVRASDLDAARTELAGTRAALGASEKHRRELEGQLERVAQAATAEERREALLPQDEHKRFEALVSRASAALGELDAIVKEAVFYYVAEGRMPWPDAFEDASRRDRAEESLREGDLAEDSEGFLVPDDEVGIVRAALEAVKELRDMLVGCSGQFDNWFREVHDAPPDLSRRRVWTQLLD